MLQFFIGFFFGGLFGFFLLAIFEIAREDEELAEKQRRERKRKRM